MTFCLVGFNNILINLQSPDYSIQTKILFWKVAEYVWESSTVILSFLNIAYLDCRERRILRKFLKRLFFNYKTKYTIILIIYMKNYSNAAIFPWLWYLIQGILEKEFHHRCFLLYFSYILQLWIWCLVNLWKSNYWFDKQRLNENWWQIHTNKFSWHLRYFDTNGIAWHK